MKLSNTKLLAGSLLLVAGILIYTSKAHATPLHKGQAVQGTYSTGKFQRNKGLHNNGLCRARWLLAFYYSKDKKQRAILKLRFKDCLKQNTKDRKHLNKLRRKRK